MQRILLSVFIIATSASDAQLHAQLTEKKALTLAHPGHSRRRGEKTENDGRGVMPAGLRVPAGTTRASHAVMVLSLVCVAGRVEMLESGKLVGLGFLTALREQGWRLKLLAASMGQLLSGRITNPLALLSKALSAARIHQAWPTPRWMHWRHCHVNCRRRSWRCPCVGDRTPPQEAQSTEAPQAVYDISDCPDHRKQRTPARTRRSPTDSNSTQPMNPIRFQQVDLTTHGMTVETVRHNLSPAELYEEAIRLEPGSSIAESGALVAYSGAKTGRSPQDKRIVKHPDSEKDVWWGAVNFPMDDHGFRINRERAIDYLNTCERLYVVDAFAGWHPQHRLKIRIICSRPYHALFMHIMLIRPTREELATFGEPDYVIFNAGRFPANRRNDLQDFHRPFLRGETAGHPRH